MKWILNKILDLLFGKQEHIDYVSTTAPRTPPPGVGLVVNVSDPSEENGPYIAGMDISDSYRRTVSNR